MFPDTNPPNLEGFPTNRLSNEIISSLVYIKKKTDLLCDGALITKKHAMFDPVCISEKVKKSGFRRNGYSSYFIVIKNSNNPLFCSEYSFDKDVNFNIRIGIRGRSEFIRIATISVSISVHN